MNLVIERFNVLQGQFESNFKYIKSKILEAKQAGYEMVVFQSNCIAGVFVKEKVLNPLVYQEIVSYNDKIRELAQGIYVVWGNLYQNQQVICIAKNDFFDFIAKKNQDALIFEDSKYFTSGEHLKEIHDLNIVIGFGKNSISDKLHLLFTEDYFEEESDVENGYVINHFGMEQVNKNVVVFDGKVQYFKNKKLQFENIAYLNAKVDFKSKQVDVLDKIVFAIKEFDNQIFNKRFKWVIGLSGGLDSTLSCALFVYALGKQRVIGYNMATKNNTQTTKSIASRLAQKLGIAFHSGEISSLVDATHQVLNQYGYQEIDELSKQNIQARIRGHLLSSFASVEKAVIVNNGNKVETALGYATLYGDLIGAFSPLADLTKVELFEIARTLNNRLNDDIIPETLLPTQKENELIWKQKPSAELSEGQFDPMKWFYHDYLVKNLNTTFTIHEFLNLYLNRAFSEEVEYWLAYYGLTNPEKFVEDLNWFLTTMQKNNFKLLQAPPMLVLTKNPFSGVHSVFQKPFEDFQYELLINKILKGGKYEPNC